MNEKTSDLPDIRYSHPSHAEFNATLAARDEPTPRDVLAPWSPSNTLPKLRRDFDQLHTYLQPRSLATEQDNQEQGGSMMVEDDHLAPTLVPPPNIRDPVDRKHFNQRWMLEHRNAVMAQAIIPQQHQQRDNVYQHFNTHSGETHMNNNQKNNPNAPLQTFKDGAAIIKLWQQEGKDAHIHVNATIGRLYKDNETGQWKESKSFNPAQLAALQIMLPKALAHASAYEHNLNAQRQEQLAAHAQAQQQPLTAQTAQQVLSQQDIIAQRDAVVTQAQPEQSNTHEYVQAHNHEPTR